MREWLFWRILLFLERFYRQELAEYVIESALHKGARFPR